MPARSSPPRATSSTATSTDGSLSTMRVATGPVMSPATVRWPSMYTPSVEVSPTWCPASLWMWASIRAVVVLPLVPVTAAIGIRLGVPGREEHVHHRAGDVARRALRSAPCASGSRAPR